METPSRSPYRPGNGIDPPYLGDRKAELELFRSFLIDPSQPHNVLVTGLRGVGKTVLLNHYAQLALEQSWLVVDREFSEADADATVFARTLLADLSRALRSLSLSERLRGAAGRLLSEVQDLLGSLTVSYGEVAVSVGKRRLPGGAPRRLDDDLREALGRICELCRRSEHPGLLLRYDEFHVIRERAGTLTLSALLAAASAVQQRELPLMLVLGGLPPLQENLARAKTYSERMFTHQVLGNLEPPEDRAALIDPAVRRGRRYSEEVVDEVMADTGGYPYFIQLYGDRLWKATDASEIGKSVLRSVKPGILATLDAGFFQSRYLRAAPAEREVLKAIAAIGERAAVRDLVGRSGRPHKDLLPRLTALSDKGLIYRPERGVVAFTAPMFGAFLRRVRD